MGNYWEVTGQNKCFPILGNNCVSFNARQGNFLESHRQECFKEMGKNREIERNTNLISSLENNIVIVLQKLGNY